MQRTPRPDADLERAHLRHAAREYERHITGATFIGIADAPADVRSDSRVRPVRLHRI
jgi:hypothetical protein